MLDVALTSTVANVGVIDSVAVSFAWKLYKSQRLRVTIVSFVGVFDILMFVFGLVSLIFYPQEYAMLTVRSLLVPAVLLSGLSLTQARAESGDNAALAEPAAEIVASDSRSDRVIAPSEVSSPGDDSSATNTVTSGNVEEIDPESLEPAGEVELKQYSVAWGGSGTMGGGTLTIDGESYPFSIVGLGFGGFGASAVEAKGVVYNLPSRDDFAGTYGNARLGMTAGDSGGGKLWLRNSNGVVMELESQMRGLALAGGIDGLVVQWDKDEQSSVGEAIDGTGEVVGKGIESGADAVESGIGKVKGWIKKKGE